MKGLRFNGGEYIEVDVPQEKLIVLEYPDYDQTVSELIRQKYSIDDEFALNSKSMQIFINSCTEEQRIKWMQEITEFSTYREECKKKAKEICGIE